MLHSWGVVPAWAQRQGSRRHVCDAARALAAMLLPGHHMMWRGAEVYTSAPLCHRMDRGPSSLRLAWLGRRGGLASAVCTMAEPWTTVEWALPARPNDPAAGCRGWRR